MTLRNPVIIEAAINGSTKKARNPHGPVAPDEIAADALDCITAGAAMIHSHIEDYKTNGTAAAECYLEGYRTIMGTRFAAILCPTACMAGDANKDGEITVDEILTAVNNALNGCGG